MEQPEVNEVQEAKAPKKKNTGLRLLIAGLVLPIISTLISLPNTYGGLAASNSGLATLIVTVSMLCFAASPVLIILGIVFLAQRSSNKGQVSSEAIAQQSESLPSEDSSHDSAILPIVFLSIRLALSIYAYYEMMFGSGSWSEGRAFLYIVGFIDMLWLIACLVLNIKSAKQAPKSQLIVSWILFATVAILAVAIILYKP